MNRSKIFLYLLVLGSLVVAKQVPQLNVLVCSIVAAYIVISRRLELLPLLILSNIPISSFMFGGGATYGTFEFTVETYETAYINIGGIPVSSGLVTVVAMAFVCYGNFVKNKQKYFPGSLSFMFLLWNVGALFALLISLNGLVLRTEAWSGPLRGYLAAAGLFYGYSLALDARHLKTTLFKDLLIFFFFIGFISILGLFHHRINFVAAGFVPGLAVLALRRRDFVSKLLGVANLVVWALYCLVGMTMGGETTLTLMMLYATSLVLGVLFLLRPGFVQNSVSKFFGWPALVLIIAYMFITIIGARTITFSDVAYSGGDISFKERVLFKIFDDRAKLWGFVVEDIMRDNKILPRTGEDLMIIAPKQGVLYVRHGAHNTYLQSLRENGLVSGGLLIILVFYSQLVTAKALRSSRYGVTSAVAIGAVTTLTFGAVTGEYVVGQTVGAFIFLLAGIAMGRDVGEGEAPPPRIMARSGRFRPRAI